MWENFLSTYRAIKGSSKKSSCLDPVLALVNTYRRDRNAISSLDAMRKELTKVKQSWRPIGNPVKKYAQAIAALEEEIARERHTVTELLAEYRTAIGEQVKFERAMLTARAPASPATARALDTSKDAVDFVKNRERMNKVYATLLSQKETDQEYCARMEDAFAKLCREERFLKYYLDEVGWTNARAWGTWMLRAMTPELLSGPEARSAAQLLRELALRANVLQKQYAERYLLELSIYCAAEADKADVRFVLGQAKSVIGVLVGPILSAAFSSGVVSMAAKGAKSLAEVGVTAGVQAAGFDSHNTHVTMTEAGKATITSANIMRFTQAWLRYVIEESHSTSAAAVRQEFGGVAGCSFLLESVINM